MNRCFYFFIGLFLLCSCNTIKDANYIRKNYPDFQQVLEHAIKRTPDACNCTYKIIKNTGGYILNLIDDNTIVASYVIWDSEKKRFNDFNVDKKLLAGPDLEVHQLNRYKNLWRQRYYQKYLFYGSDSSYKESLKYISRTKNKSNDDLFTIASLSASESFRITSDRIFRNQEYGLEQKEEVTKLQKISLDYYKQLFNSDSLYETTLFDLNMKYIYDMYGFDYHDYIINSTEELNTFYSKGLKLPDSVVNRYEKVLDKCDINSILVAAGDDLSFGLMHFQSEYNYRNDVLILNYWMINSPICLDALLGKHQINSTMDLIKLQINQNLRLISSSEHKQGRYSIEEIISIMEQTKEDEFDIKKIEIYDSKFTELKSTMDLEFRDAALMNLINENRNRTFYFTFPASNRFLKPYNYKFVSWGDTLNKLLVY